MGLNPELFAKILSRSADELPAATEAANHLADALSSGKKFDEWLDDARNSENLSPAVKSMLTNDEYVVTMRGLVTAGEFNDTFKAAHTAATSTEDLKALVNDAFENTPELRALSQEHKDQMIDGYNTVIENRAAFIDRRAAQNGTSVEEELAAHAQRNAARDAERAATANETTSAPNEPNTGGNGPRDPEGPNSTRLNFYELDSYTRPELSTQRFILNVDSGSPFPSRVEKHLQEAMLNGETAESWAAKVIKGEYDKTDLSRLSSTKLENLKNHLQRSDVQQRISVADNIGALWNDFDKAFASADNSIDVDGLFAANGITTQTLSPDDISLLKKDFEGITAQREASIQRETQHIAENNPSLTPQDARTKALSDRQERFVEHKAKQEALSASMPEQADGLNGTKIKAHFTLVPNSFIPRPVFFPVKAMRARSFEVTKPVIEFLDNQFLETGVGKRLQDLDKEVLETLENGGDPRKIINDFAENPDNIAALTEFRDNAQYLRKYVEDNYETNKVVTWGHDLTIHQKNAMLSYIEDMEKMANDVLKGTDGENGQQILESLEKINNGTWSAESVENSVTGLSKSNMMANNAQIRLTGNWPNTNDKATGQWIDGLGRSFDTGVYNPHFHDKPILIDNLKGDNLERLWQNHFLDKFAERGADGKLTVDYTQVETKKLFVGQLMTFIDEGMGHEAMFAVQQLARLAQPTDLADKLPIPNVAQYDEAVATLRSSKGGLSDEQEYYLNQIREFVANENVRGAGARDSTWLGFKERFSEDNRQNRYKAETQTYVWEFKDRYRGANDHAKPWNIVKNNWMKYNFIARPLHFLKGGLDIQPGKSENWGRVTDDYSAAAIQRTMKAEGETNWSPVRRSLLRSASGGLINDASLNGPLFINIKPTKLGWAALGSAGIWGAGEAFGSETASDVGSMGVTVFTTPAQTMYGQGPIVDFITGFSDDNPSLDQPRDDDSAPVVTRPTAEDMSEARDLSEENVDAIVELREKVSLEFDEHIAALNEYQSQMTGALNDLKRYSESKGETDKVAEYNALQEQLNAAVSDMRNELRSDKSHLDAEGEKALNEIKSLDQFVQDGSSVSVAQQRIDEQTNVIVEHANLASVLSAHRLAGLNNMTAAFDTAISQAKRLDQVADSPSTSDILAEQAAGSNPDASITPPVVTQPGTGTGTGTGTGKETETTVTDTRPAALRTEIAAANASGTNILNALNEIKADLAELDTRQELAQQRIDLAKELGEQYSDQKFTEHLPYMQSYIQEIEDRRADLEEAQQIIVREATEANALIKATDGLQNEADVATAQANNAKISTLETSILATAKLQQQRTDSFNNEFNTSDNPILDYYIGGGMRVDEGLIKAGGGPQGVLYQTFGSGGADITSVAEGWWKTAAGGISSLTSSWDRMKRDAGRYGTQGEQNMLNWVENGALAIGLMWGGKHLLNLAGIDNKLVRGAMLVGIIGYALHRTGVIGKEMHDIGSENVRQSSYGARAASTPTTPIDTSKITTVESDAAQGSKAEPNTDATLNVSDPAKTVTQDQDGSVPEVNAANGVDSSVVVSGNQSSIPSDLMTVNIDQVIGYENLHSANAPSYAMRA